MHCAGLEISHFLPDKPQREYDLVFDVKVDGWLSLLRALRGTEIGTAVVFSSIAARFGNAGQTDYSAANDLLCKSISSLRRSAGTRGVAIDWTAWASIGMASRGSIPKMMEMAGIDMLPPDARRSGGPARDHGRRRRRRGAGRRLARRARRGAPPDRGPRPRSRRREGGGSAGADERADRLDDARAGLTVLPSSTPAARRSSYDHRIDGIPVLPGVMGMEGFAEAAHALLPGWRLSALEDVDLHAPFKFYRDEPRTLELRARCATAARARSWRTAA